MPRRVLDADDPELVESERLTEDRAKAREYRAYNSATKALKRTAGAPDEAPVQGTLFTVERVKAKQCLSDTSYALAAECPERTHFTQCAVDALLAVKQQLESASVMPLPLLLRVLETLDAQLNGFNSKTDDLVATLGDVLSLRFVNYTQLQLVHQAALDDLLAAEAPNPDKFKTFSGTREDKKKGEHVATTFFKAPDFLVRAAHASRARDALL